MGGPWEKLTRAHIRRPGIAKCLPNPSLITFPGKMPAIISLSGTGSCGGNDFWRPRFKEDGLSAEKAGGHQVEKRCYDLENKTRSTPGKVHNYSSYFIGNYSVERLEDSVEVEQKERSG